MEYVTLNNGVKMPMAGIGTFLLTPDEAEASVLSALQNGYRLIDTANAYVNEKAVGRAMKKSGLPREEIFLETKLWPAFYEQPDAVEKTLARLDTDYIDLLLIHQPAGNFWAGYRLMEQAYEAGKVRAIGLSNFSTAQIEEILRTIIPKGIGIECNTNRGNTPLPDADILKLYRSLGGEIITLGSDAHVTNHLGCAIPARQELLRDCGFRYFTTFDRMKPSFQAL